MLSIQQQQFRVGLMVICTMMVGVVLLVRAGKIDQFLKPRYAVVIRFPSAAGVYPSLPVVMRGIGVGTVRQVKFDEGYQAVNVLIEISQEHKLPVDTMATISRSLLGDTLIELTPGQSKKFVQPGQVISGDSGTDPMALVQRLEQRLLLTMDRFAATSEEWQRLATNLNGLVETNQGSLGTIVERTAIALDEFQVALKSVNKVVADPKTQRAVEQTMQALPELVRETRQAIAGTRVALENMNQNLTNLNGLTGPLAKSGPVLVARLESGAENLDVVLEELSRFARVLNQQEGSLQKLMKDPSLYQHMDRSAESLAALLQNLEPMLVDLREFSDKIARRPELLGVGGSLSPSSGLKDSELLAPSPKQTGKGTGPIRQTSGQR